MHKRVPNNDKYKSFFQTLLLTLSQSPFYQKRMIDKYFVSNCDNNKKENKEQCLLN